MNNAIYRQQAIDTIKELREVAWKNWHEPTLSPNVVIDALSGLPSAPSWTGELIPWIPCSERLPELDADGYSDKVLVCFSNFTGCEICEYRECDDCHGWYVGDSDENPEDIGVHVSAWMPLPEPYTEETNA